MEQHILIVDPRRPRDQVLFARLAACGLRPHTAETADDARDWLTLNDPACIVVRVEDATQAAACDLRSHATAPIVAVCDEHDERLVVTCLRAGADTVVVSGMQLAARIQRLVAREVTPMRPPARRTLTIGDVTIDCQAHTATRAGATLSLSPTEFRLLVALARRRGAIATHDALHREVWNDSRGAGTDGLRLCVRQLRKKLADGEDGRVFLLNRRGVGYQLVGQGVRQGQGRGHGW